uniref:Integral membrane protein 2 n=1 Tax=Cyprinus carpio TaxID=7962 RepID=A0A8C1K6G7_CYPCA
MVKVSFNKALAIKDPKKETLIPDVQDPEAAVLVRPQSKVWCWCFCLGLALVLSGVVVGGAYLYRYYVLEMQENVDGRADDWKDTHTSLQLVSIEVIPFNRFVGMYLPQTYLVREEMMITERLDSTSELGYYINKLCKDKDTYRLQRIENILGMQKREALNCYKIRHFENKFVVETLICEP